MTTENANTKNAKEVQITRLLKRNSRLMKEFGISSVEGLIKALGDRYDNETRKKLMPMLSPKDQALVREYYLRNCNAGLDRFPACLKVIIKWSIGVYHPDRNDYYTNIDAEYDRISRSVKYSYKTHRGIEVSINAPLSEEFENAFFPFGEAAQGRDENESYIIDSDMVSILCELADGSKCELHGNYPGYHPYDDLYRLFNEHFRELMKQLQEGY